MILHVCKLIEIILVLHLHYSPTRRIIGYDLMVSFSQSFVQLIFDFDYVETREPTRGSAIIFGIFIPNNLSKTESG